MVERRGAGDQRFHRVLGEVTDAQIRMRLAFAGHGRELADQGLDQRRLARAVRAEQADAVAGFEGEVHFAEDSDSFPFKGKAGMGMVFSASIHTIPTQPSP